MASTTAMLIISDALAAGLTEPEVFRDGYMQVRFALAIPKTDQTVVQEIQSIPFDIDW